MKIKFSWSKLFLLVGLAPIIILGGIVAYRTYDQKTFARTVSKELVTEADTIRLPNQLRRSESLYRECSDDFYGGGPRCSNYVYLYFGSNANPDDTVREALRGLKSAGWVVEDFTTVAEALEGRTNEIQKNPLKHLDSMSLPVSKTSRKGVKINGYVNVYHKTTNYDSGDDPQGDLKRLRQEYPEYEIIYEVSSSTDYVSKKSLKKS